MQHARHFCFLQARSIVFKRQLIFGFIHAEAAQAVRVGKLAKAPQLLGPDRSLQLVGDFNKGHAWDYSRPRICGRKPGGEDRQAVADGVGLT